MIATHQHDRFHHLLPLAALVPIACTVLTGCLTDRVSSGTGLLAQFGYIGILVLVLVAFLILRTIVLVQEEGHRGTAHPANRASLHSPKRVTHAPGPDPHPGTD